MDIEISDIQQLANDKIEITFCGTTDWEDFMKLTLDKADLWKIHKFCGDHLSYSAQLRREKTQRFP